MLAYLQTIDVVRYQKQIRTFPFLRPEEEAGLARRWRAHHDREAVHKLLTSHLRLVIRVARSYRGYGFPLSDLISEGNLGLVKATKGFDPEKGARFSTYAVWWIRAAIQDYILRSWSIVKISSKRSERTLFFNLQKLKSRIGALQDGDLHPDQIRFIAQQLDVGTRDVSEMDRRLRGDVSLNFPTRSEQHTGEYQDWLVDERSSQEQRLAEQDEFEARFDSLREAIGSLSHRERHIFEMRRLADEPMPLETLALKYGVSRERVRQIEAQAFEKVRRAVRQAYDEKFAGTGSSLESTRTQSTRPASFSSRALHQARIPLCAD